jgi:CO/xanthine dehydrogenase Mo-binding subunit
MSRALPEGVGFDSKSVRAVDRVRYPTVDIKDIPDVTAFIVNPDGKFVPPSGSGEPVTRPTAAAIANDVFDATGVRVRRQPLLRRRSWRRSRPPGKRFKVKVRRASVGSG